METARHRLQDKRRIIDGKIVFRGLIAMPDGSVKYETTAEGAIEDARIDWKKGWRRAQGRSRRQVFRNDGGNVATASTWTDYQVNGYLRRGMVATFSYFFEACVTFYRRKRIPY